MFFFVMYLHIFCLLSLLVEVIVMGPVLRVITTGSQYQTQHLSLKELQCCAEVSLVFCFCFFFSKNKELIWI